MTRWMGSVGVLVTSILLLTAGGCSKEKKADQTGSASGPDQMAETPTREATADLNQPSIAGAVVVYVSADRQVAAPILEAFEEKTGIRVRAQYDTELTKTTGLVARLRDEHDRGRPAADVFWSSEAFNTIQLANDGVLQASNVNLDFTPRWQDPEGRWYGFAARPRVLAYAPQRVTADELPQRWLDLSHPRFTARLAMANPGWGTTQGHVAALFAVYGDVTARRFLQQLTDNGLLVVGGNSLAVQRLVDGEVDFAMTDADDVWAARARGEAVDMIYPRHTDQVGGGTLVIPNTVARVAGGTNGDAADLLIAYLLSEDVERILAESYSHNIPTHPALQAEFSELVVADALDLPLPDIARWMDQAALVSAETMGMP